VAIIAAVLTRVHATTRRNVVPRRPVEETTLLVNSRNHVAYPDLDLRPPDPPGFRLNHS